jgi:hypothetical protein
MNTIIYEGKNLLRIERETGISVFAMKRVLDRKKKNNSLNNLLLEMKQRKKNMSYVLKKNGRNGKETYVFCKKWEALSLEASELITTLDEAMEVCRLSIVPSDGYLKAFKKLENFLLEEIKKVKTREELLEKSTHYINNSKSEEAFILKLVELS